MIFQLVIALVGLSLTYIYVRTQKRMRLWSDMGVAEDPGTFPLGNAVGYTKACSNQTEQLLLCITGTSNSFRRSFNLACQQQL